MTWTGGQFGRQAVPVPLTAPHQAGAVRAVAGADVRVSSLDPPGVFSAAWRGQEPVAMVSSPHFTMESQFSGMGCFKHISLKNSLESLFL